jgi:hypothetical protein
MGQAILIYSNDHHGDYPPDLGTLIKTRTITGDAFVCPSGKVELPEELEIDVSPSRWQIGSNEVAVRVHREGLTNDAPADRIVLYERPDGP